MDRVQQRTKRQISTLNPAGEYRCESTATEVICKNMKDFLKACPGPRRPWQAALIRSQDQPSGLQQGTALAELRKEQRVSGPQAEVGL